MQCEKCVGDKWTLKIHSPQRVPRKFVGFVCRVQPTILVPIHRSLRVVLQIIHNISLLKLCRLLCCVFLVASLSIYLHNWGYIVVVKWFTLLMYLFSPVLLHWHLANHMAVPISVKSAGPILSKLPAKKPPKPAWQRDLYPYFMGCTVWAQRFWY